MYTAGIGRPTPATHCQESASDRWLCIQLLYFEGMMEVEVVEEEEEEEVLKVGRVAAVRATPQQQQAR